MTWDPQQYERFREERARPFHDLLALVERRPDMTVADLGCGTGETTLLLHRALSARDTLGIDSSSAMLARAPAAPGLRFRLADLAAFDEPRDLIFSNAALHWVPDHEPLFARLAGLLGPSGQLAVQMPRNEAHASHQTALAVAREPDFARLLQGYERRSPVLEPSRYATLLHRLGFARQRVRLEVYAHPLPSSDAVVEWVRGSLLTDYQARLSPEDFARFVERYRALLRKALGAGPVLLTYDRVLLHAGK